MPRLNLSNNRFVIDGAITDVWGIRTASGTMDQPQTDHLIAQLDEYLEYGVNAVTVFYMGCGGGNYDPFSPDGTTLDAGHQDRMRQIATACDERGMILITGIFYQRAPFGLTDRTAVIEAARVSTESLRGCDNVIINIANEQNSPNWPRHKAVYDFQDPQAIIDLCAIVHETDPDRLVGGGGYDHNKNILIGRSPDVDILLFDTCGPEDSGELYERFVSEGVQNKPIVNVESFGAWAKFGKQELFPEEMKSAYYKEIDATVKHDGLSLFFHHTTWCQGNPSRYDIAGPGTADSPGIRWYFDYLRTAKP